MTTSANSPRSGLKTLRFLAYPALALALSVYVLIDVRTHASFWIDYVWAKQFSDQLWAGELYPRWLERSHGGLGAPVFYFYAPLSFYLVAAFSWAGTYTSLIITFLLVHNCSGLAMHRWLQPWGPRAAWVGALIYMALPYHLIDFGRRAALAEFTAFIFVPLVALGIDKAAKERNLLFLALAYAGLILSHLPAALLASLFLIPLLWIRHRNSPYRLRPAVGLALGLGLSAVYWLPAVLLTPMIDPSLWARHFSPPYWQFANVYHWPERRETWLIAAAILGSVWAAAWLARRRSNLFWPAATAFLAILAANVTPWLWSVSLLAKVQFPWRVMVLVDFALATAVAVALSTSVSRKWLAIALGPLALLSVAVMALPLPKGAYSLPQLDAQFPDVLEYRIAALRIDGRAVMAAHADRPIAIANAVSGFTLLLMLALWIMSRSAHDHRWREGRRSTPSPAAPAEEA